MLFHRRTVTFIPMYYNKMNNVIQFTLILALRLSIVATH